MQIQKQCGFSLMELAVVLVIVGSVLAAAASSLRVYYAQKEVIETRDTVKEANSALKEFYGLKGRYPCPADPNLAPGDANYGVEQCRADVNIPLGTDPCPTNIVCTNDGARDANGDSVADIVMIGALPAQTLADDALFSGFTLSSGQDSYNMKISYAVSELMTDQSKNVSDPVNAQLGAISLKDEQNRDVTFPADSAHYVVFSHGENGRGGYSVEGAWRTDCIVIATGNPPTPGNNLGTTGIEVEKENCDNNDAIFVKGLRSMADTDDYFDDVLFFNTTASMTLWRRKSGPSNETYLYNTNAGNVGINTTSPSNKLYVQGNVRAENQTQADGGYCTEDDTTDCLNPEVLGGTSMNQCPAGQIATGVENNTLVCEDLFSSGTTLTFSCPTGEAVVSFSNLGNFNCAVP